MSVEGAFARNEVEHQEGLTLVRRFTGELKGDTTLEHATTSAQQEQDAIAEARMEARMRALLQDENPSNALFHEAETARLLLLKTRHMFETPEQPSTLVKMGFSRKTARMTANEALESRNVYGFTQLSDYVNGLESAWKSKQSKSAQRFRRLCGGLDAHKNAFAVFPSQNDYTSALCGSLKFIIAAAVNHDEIADTISETVTEITEKAARAAKILLVLHTHAIRKLFSELYARVFHFYRDAIEWYMRSKTSRFFSSFNEKMRDRYVKAAKEIDDTITEMYREQSIAQAARLKIFCTEQERRDEMIRQRHQSPDASELTFAGERAQQLLLSLHKSMCIQASAVQSVPSSGRSEFPALLNGNTRSPDLINRATAGRLAADLQHYVVGTEGHSLFNDGSFWLPEVDVASKLHDWIGNEASSPTLWISSLEFSQPDIPGSRAAALNALVAAWTAELPIISHFCERPRFATLARDRDVEKVGLLGMVYSLIAQLLQFEFEGDAFEVAQSRVEKLDGSDESWPIALEMLSALLQATPHLRTCVIDGLNDLTFAAGASWCNGFLQVLFRHQESFAGRFRILLTTAGQSRVVQDHVSITDRVFTQTGTREVIRNGQWYDRLES
ncbi:hypothetical protein AA0118_g4286 [Alternaria tenuissima]|nr:hypothetical protein AA0118_g4286 [Alternaria tenuissima]